MGPLWPRLALHSLVGGGPVGPGCGLGWPRQEWPGVAKPLIQLHSVAFGCISLSPNPHPRRLLRRQEPRTQPFLPSAPCALRCRARWIPAFAGMTAGFAGTTYVTNVRGGAAIGQWAVVVGCNPHPNPLPEGEGTCRGQEPRTQPFRPSAPCALRCRARWIPAFAGMTGPGAGNVGHNPSAPPPRVRSAVAHAGFQPSLE